MAAPPARPLPKRASFLSILLVHFDPLPSLLAFPCLLCRSPLLLLCTLAVRRRPSESIFNSLAALRLCLHMPVTRTLHMGGWMAGMERQAM